jgi:hypothetical protein
MRPLRDELQTFAYKTLVVVGALTLCVGLATAATTIGTNISTDGMISIATSSPGSVFSLGGIANFIAATSTFIPVAASISKAGAMP